MHQEDIKAELRKKGYTLSAVAAECGVSRSMVTHVINGYAKSAHIQMLIARIIGLDIDSIWPPQHTTAPGLRRTSTAQQSRAAA